IVTDLVGSLLIIFREMMFNSFYPVLQEEIGVGSAFEGWIPSEEGTVYQVLVPLMPPRGHAFHLELNSAKEDPARTFSIRVELLCTCTSEQMPGQMLCFLHQPEEELKSNQDPSLLHTLCTDSYLDVQKTSRWFHQLLYAAWVVLPYSSRYTMKVLQSSYSCCFQIRRDEEKLDIDMMFGVQQGDSDIFLSSQQTEAFLIPSTIWSETYAVAEAKFFRHIAGMAPPDSWHLKCLQLCARILVGSGFHMDILKTAVMHLLTEIPLSQWRRKDCLLRLQDIMLYLGCCLEGKCLNHFFFGNEQVPVEITLPQDFRNVVPPNLFHHLAQDPSAHSEALREFDELQDQ
ncbi:IPIL1 protein, partial [Heliornis fulica]|nr:IPIL1 protein [Heliornis fulica]